MGLCAVAVVLGVLSVAASGPILTYEEYYAKLLGSEKDLEKQHLSGSLVRDGDTATMTCSLDDANNTACVKWVRLDQPFDRIQTLRSYGCENNKHTVHDDRQRFTVAEVGSNVTFTFQFQGMKDADMGVYYCFQISPIEPYHKWKTFVIHD